MMRLLLIDTCGAEGSVALAEGAAVLSTEVLPGRSASERLVPVVRAMLVAQGWVLAELAAIVVMHGPGSFTGVRVGVSAAKGLSEAARVPVVAVSRLQVLAGLAEEDGCAVLDAGRGEFYYGEYRGGVCVREALLTTDELVVAVDGEIAIICEPKVAEALAGMVAVRMVAEPRAGDALAIAVGRVAAGMFDDVATLDANYLRRTDAQLFAWAKPAAV
jgi:tRNA threonylcarbamoyladenosine biosynthesis protein TsaB